MCKRYIALCCAILSVGAVILGIGLYQKYYILKPLGMAQDTNAMALPFVLMVDEGMKKAIADAKKQQTEPPATQPGEMSSTPPQTGVPTQGTTAPVETDSSANTTVSTQATEPPVTQPPVTQPPVTNPPMTQPPATQPPVTNPPTTVPPPVSADPSMYDDALFIGDSRTVGLREYARSSLGQADFFCDVGMSVFNYSASKLETQLNGKQYGKIFICLGINECGYPIDSLIGNYKKLVERVRQYQPDAVIILQGIMTVGKAKANEADYFKPSHLVKINERIAAMADNSRIYYIDVNTAFADENGYLPPAMSGDGVHLYAKCYVDWVNFISGAVIALGL